MDEEKVETTSVYSACPLQGGKILTITVLLEGHPIVAIVDSAAQVSVIKKELIDKWLDKVDRKPIILRGIGKDEVRGEIVEGVKLTLGNEPLFETLVAADIDEDLLLGIDFLTRHGVCVDFGRHEIVWKKQVLRAKVVRDAQADIKICRV